MANTLVQLQSSDGSWGQFEECWRQQCDDYGEDYSQYATGSLPVLGDLVRNPRQDAGVYALVDPNGNYQTVAQVNSAYIPGYVEKVMRVRHMLMSPRFDFGDYPIEEYTVCLVQMFTRTVMLSVQGLPSRHIKFHLRSPADRQFFAGMVNPLDEAGLFSEVAMKGSWLYLSHK